MSFGIAAYGTDNKIAFHSDYSSIVYAGEMSVSASPVRPVFTGTYANSISAAQKSANYDMGWIIQYKISLDVDFLVPFYTVGLNGQEVGIIDVINEGTDWVINAIYYESPNSQGYLRPRMFAFAPITDLPGSYTPAVTMEVYNSGGERVFSDNAKPLRIDDVVQMSPPLNIKTGARGVCGAGGTACHVNLVSDQHNDSTGNYYVTSTSMFHVIPSAYGGLAYHNSGTGSQNCGPAGIFTRHYAWDYRSWASFRGVVKSLSGQRTHSFRWMADYAGAAYQIGYGGCGLGGFLGALLGLLIVVATGGTGLALIGGLFGGFAVGSVSVGTTPTLRAYTQDENIDTKPSKMMITDKSYYGIQ